MISHMFGGLHPSYESSCFPVQTQGHLLHVPPNASIHVEFFIDFPRDFKMLHIDIDSLTFPGFHRFPPQRYQVFIDFPPKDIFGVHRFSQEFSWSRSPKDLRELTQHLAVAAFCSFAGLVLSGLRSPGCG